MPWKTVSALRQRVRLVLQCLRGLLPISRLAAQAGVSRPCAYKWLERFRKEGSAGLADRSSRPRKSPRRISALWRDRLRRLRGRRPTWGPKKLFALLRRVHPRGVVPSVRTIARYLKVWGLIGPAPARKGPWVSARAFTPARQANDVWTLDFKGWFRTGGQRVEPLTVRDLFSRFILGIFLLPNQSDQEVRRCLTRLFKRWGLPKVIRVDNGSPFGGKGALGLSRLSVWWISLGIAVEFSRPAHPEDNAAHEQMHRVYKREVAAPPARTRARQQKRSQAWVRDYNQQRPHEALGQRPPADFFKKSPRRMPQRIRAWVYPKGWEKRLARSGGRVRWKGRARFVGRAFAGQQIGFKKKRGGIYHLYFRDHLIGALHEEDAVGIRPARLHRKRKSKPKA